MEVFKREKKKKLKCMSTTGHIQNHMTGVTASKNSFTLLIWQSFVKISFKPHTTTKPDTT